MTFNVFAYNKDDHNYTTDIRRDAVGPWNIEKALRWAIDKGFDTILIERSEHPTGSPLVTHHVCNDPACPGGC